VTPLTPVAATPLDISEPDLAFRTDADPEHRLTAFLFEQLFGSRATLFMAVPGGMTLFGHPGERLALAIPLKWGASAAASARDDGLVELRSVNHAGKELTLPLGTVDDGPGWAAHPLNVISAVIEAGHPLGGMSLLVGTALPEGAGMQADAGLASVIASALGGLFGADLPLGRRAALGDVSAQLASMTCPDDTALLVDTREMTAEALPFELAGAGLRLLIVDLGVDVTATPAPGAPDLAEAAAALLRAGKVPGLGPLLGRSGRALAPEVALVVDAACAAGAHGAGTLPGGCLVALVPVDRLGSVRAAVTAAWPGPRPPKFLTATSARGGRPLVTAPELGLDRP
jgi:galactokinase